MKVLAIIIAVLISLIMWGTACFALAYPFMLLWNHGMSPAFRLPELGYWNSWCLMMFSAMFVVRPSTEIKGVKGS